MPLFQLQNLLQKKLYKITSMPVYDYMSGSYNNDELAESINVVTSTKDMPQEDMLDSMINSWFMQTFHINGLTTYISRFLEKYSNIDYSEFYDKLYVLEVNSGPSIEGSSVSEFINAIKAI